jgi:hypothetical protein
MGRFKTKDLFHMFVSLTWLSGLIYYMLGQLIDTHSSDQTHRRINSDVTGTAQMEVRELLLQIGFVQEPKLYPEAYLREDNLPVFAIIVEQHQVI